MLEKIPLTDDILTEMVQTYLPLHIWPRIEVVSKQFQRAVHLAYRSLTSLDMYDFFPKDLPENMLSRDIDGNSNWEQAVFLNKIEWHCTSVKRLKWLCYFQRSSNPVHCYPRGPTIEQMHFDYLGNIHQTLTYLDLSHCRLYVQAFAEFLGQLTNLTSLDLNGCSYFAGFDSSDESAELQLASAFANLPKLQHLTLFEMKFCSGSFLASINAASLKSLSFNQLKFASKKSGAGKMRTFLKTCIQLERLNLELGVEFGDKYILALSLLTCLPNLHSLETVRLKSHAYISHSDKNRYNHCVLDAAFAKCTHLRELSMLGRTFYAFKERLTSVVSGCPNLEHLEIDFDRFVVDTKSLETLTHLRRLKQLHLICKDDFPLEKPLRSILRSFRDLECIEIENGTYGRTLLDSLTELEHLRRIRFDQSGKMDEDSRTCVDDEILIKWCERFRQQLTHIEIPHSEVTDNGISALARCCPNIQILDLREAHASDVSARTLAESCRLLEKVDLYQYRYQGT